MGLEPPEFFYANLLHEQILFVIWNSKNQQQPIVQNTCCSLGLTRISRRELWKISYK